ncbi:hypothetical protein AAGR22_08895 [Erwinia sp. HDF1-3R]|uniref:hypothetical protein n=1 Tax=Erwinia sp. HDF1-3R TaxID=3141543 RepID=UPI0031F481CF
MDQLEILQHVVGHPFLADDFAAQFGMLVVENPRPERIDNVELFTIQMRVDAAKGMIAQAKLAAEEDGILEQHELKTVARNVLKSVRHTKQSFLYWAALHGMQADAVDLMAGRRG